MSVAPPPVIPPPADPAPSPSDSAPPRVTIAEAVKAYLAVRSGSGIVSATLRKHKTFVKLLEAFAAGRGYVMLEQLTSAALAATALVACCKPALQADWIDPACALWQE